MVSMTVWMVLTSVTGMFTYGVLSKNIPSTATYDEDGRLSYCNCHNPDAVYDEIMKVIAIVNEYTYKGNSAAASTSPQLKRFLQEDEDYPDPAAGLIEIQSIVPMIFKIVGSAISLNSSGLTEGSWGLLPENVSNRITSVLGTLAGNILGPGVFPTTTKAPPPRRRRRTTTTTVATAGVDASTEKSTTVDGNAVSAATSEPPTTVNVVPREVNTTSAPDPETTDSIIAESSTTGMLFKESSLGELPVYAGAYAPNYVHRARTTPYPVYANNFLHVLYPAPTTTTIATTTTTGSTTSTDPNSYAIALPFDYQEGIGLGVIASTDKVDMILPPNSTYPPQPQQTPPEYGSEYEYEEQTEEAKVA